MSAGIVAFGAVVSMTAVLLVFQYGQPRIFFSMSRDGLLPKYFAQVHPKYGTPHHTILWTGIVVATISAFANINWAVELTNIGTLFAFVLVCIGVIILRVREPNRERPFRTPLVPWLPFASIAVNVVLMASLPWATWERLIVWMALGLACYAAYGRRHSRLRAERRGAGAALPASVNA